MAYIVREVSSKDASQLLDLSQVFLLCSLPDDLEGIEKKIQTSQDSFQKKIPKEERNFVFVLEDLSTGKIVGSSQILSSYKKKNVPHFLLFKEEDSLVLSKDEKGKFQMGGLVLSPELRNTKDKLGLLLGGSRFLYIKNFEEEFSSILEVNLTAVFDKEKKYNAFWEEVGRLYKKMDFVEALKTYKKNPLQFFSDLPKDLKISLKSLSNAAQGSLTSIHPETLPAYKALLKIGFEKTNKHHFLDGGIYLEAQTKKISLICQTLKCKLKKSEKEEGELHLVAQQTSEGFVSCFLKGFIEGEFFHTTKIPSFFKEAQDILVKG